MKRLSLLLLSAVLLFTACESKKESTALSNISQNTVQEVQNILMENYPDLDVVVVDKGVVQVAS